MKRLLAASLTGLALLSGSALAADLPPAPQVYKAPAVVAPAYNWSGFYLNAGGGYGMWNADTQVFFPGGACLTCVVDTFGGRGYFGTGGGGYDFQLGGLGMGAWNPMIVVGLMADYNFESFKGTTDVVGAAVAQIKETAAWAGGARIGLAFGPNFFTYMNGGATGTRFGGTSFVSSITGAPVGPTSSAFLEDRLVPRRRHRDFAGSYIAGRLFPTQRISLRLLQHDECSASCRGCPGRDDRLPPGGADAQYVARLQINGNKRRGKLGDRGVGG